jgi:hypothetical protein
VTLSNWTTHEVLALKDEAGGGNAHARKTWLGQLEGSGLVLRPDDPLDKVKAFVNDAYNHKRYYRDAEGSGSSPTTQRNHGGATPSSAAAASSGVRPPTPPPPPASKHETAFAPRGPAPAASAAATDFLDFAADFSSPPNGTQPHAGDDWQPFQAGPGAAANGHHHHPQGNGNGNINGNGSAFGFIAAPAFTPAHAAADFGDFMAAPPAPAPVMQQMQQQQQQPPKPVMLSSAHAFDDPFAGLHNPVHPPHASFGPPRPVRACMRAFVMCVCVCVCVRAATTYSGDDYPKIMCAAGQLMIRLHSDDAQAGKGDGNAPARCSGWVRWRDAAFGGAAADGHGHGHGHGTHGWRWWRWRAGKSQCRSNRTAWSTTTSYIIKFKKKISSPSLPQPPLT